MIAAWLVGIVFALLLLTFTTLAVLESGRRLGATELTEVGAFLALLIATVVGGLFALLIGWKTLVLAGIVCLFVVARVFGYFLELSVMRGLGVAVMAIVFSVPVAITLIVMHGAIFGFSDSSLLARAGLEGPTMEQKIEEKVKPESSALKIPATDDAAATDEVAPEPAAAATPGAQSRTVVLIQLQPTSDRNDNVVYRPDALNNVDSHVNRRVRIRTSRGSVREGVLVSVGESRATVQKSRTERGFAYEIPLDEIEGFEVSR